MSDNTESYARRVGLAGLIANALLCVMKFTVGLLCASGALVSDAANSASDVLNALIAMVGVKLGNKQADPEHPYGHARFECVASILLSFLVFLTGLSIGIAGVKTVFADSGELAIPGIPALVAALVCCCVKEILYRCTIRAANALDSVALRAAAWDHRSDVFASLGVFVGVLGSRLGLPVLDAIASVIISVLILRVAIRIFIEAVNKTVDQSCAPEIEQRLRQAALLQEGVQGVDLMRTRQFGPGIYVDMEIAADGDMTLHQAHDIAERVHDAVEAAEPNIQHCMVHVNPAQADCCAMPVRHK